jgi:hypothetical protein
MLLAKAEPVNTHPGNFEACIEKLTMLTDLI